MIYIADDLGRDPHKHFEKGITYVRSQLKYSPDGINVHKDITLTKIEKTICKYSPEHTVGEHSMEPSIHTINNNNIISTVHAFKKMDRHQINHGIQGIG